MSATVTPVQETIYTVLRAFLLTLIDTEVIQGLGNRVSAPIGGFIAMTAGLTNRLSTNISAYNDPGAGQGTKSSSASMSYTVQVDCYGPVSSDWASIIYTMFSDTYACEQLAPTIQPLYADSPIQLPLVASEDEYEQRWMVSLVLQFNPVVAVPQEFADTVVVDLVNVDTTFNL